MGYFPNYFKKLQDCDKTEYVIAQDVNEAGAKRFICFDTYEQFKDFYQNETKKNYYEVIQNEKASKLYIDLDIKNTSLSNAQLVLMQIINNIQSFTKLFINYECEPIVSEAHSETKKSYHIVFPEIILVNQVQRKIFSDKFSEYLPENIRQFFDKSVYSKNRCYRLLGSSKYGQERPLEPFNNHSNKLEDHMVTTQYNSNSKQLKFEEIENTNVVIENTPENIKNILDNIDVNYWGKRESWVQIGSALKNCNVNFEVFDEYSRQSANYGGTMKLWNSIRQGNVNDCGMGTLYYYASKSETFNEKTMNEKLQALTKVQKECTLNIIETNTLSHDTCAKLLKDHYPDLFIYSETKWYEKLHSGRYEEINSDPETKLCNHISEYFDLFEKTIINKMNDTERKTLKRAKHMTEKYEYKTSVIKELRGKYFCERLNEKFNAKQNLIGFNNGVYDLDKFEFRKATKEDYISWTVGYDYEENPEEKDIKYLEDCVFSLFEYKDTAHYFIKHLGSLLYGGNKEELIHFWVGNGRNGKGTIDELLRSTLGPYYTVLEDAFFTATKKNQDEATPALLAMRNTRLAMTSEPEGEVPYLSSKFKKLSGNDPIYGRALYQNGMVMFIPTFKPVIQTNHLPKFTDVDVGLLQRIRVIKFCYTFVVPSEYDAKNKYHKKIDYNLKTNLKKLRPQFMYLLIKWYQLYLQETLDTPSKEIIEITNTYRADIDSVRTFINETTVHEEKAYIPIHEVLFSYNAWAKDKLLRNKLLLRVKSHFDVQLVKIDGKMIQCLINRKFLF